MDKGLYQYDPETKEFKLRRNRQVWQGNDDAHAERHEAVPDPDREAAEAAAPGAGPERYAVASPAEPAPPAGHVSSAPERVKRRKRAPSPYMPQEPREPESNLVRRLIWIFIFIMLVAWVLMISPLMNRVQTQEQRLFREDGNGGVFPRL